jgi:hypothetical protein
MAKPMRILQALIGAFAFLVAAPNLLALPLSETRIIIEVNATDGDAGIQIFGDAEGWKSLQVFDPQGHRIVDVTADGSVGVQGITEIFFESAEPSFDEQPLAEFLALFPEGKYRFEGMTVNGNVLKGIATLTHNIPAGPEIVAPEEDAALDSRAPLLVRWEPVTDPFPGVNSPGQIAGYQVIVLEDGVKVPPTFSVDLPATATQVTVPPEFIRPRTDYKVEVLVKEAGGNQTISERTFKTLQ